ncbi:hypothetical protein CEXT_532891 [Caerostris extrusa]|uniref:Uncharacterized protein n=1 Tax=Caerostris extrusa TaxID=172846 RepID=A0AAV4PAB7_CAEEX|nr:hypothetical protein CEXT_532891 [Caerostris extrusa]
MLKRTVLFYSNGKWVLTNIDGEHCIPFNLQTPTATLGKVIFNEHLTKNLNKHNGYPDGLSRSPGQYLFSGLGYILTDSRKSDSKEEEVVASL